MFEWVAKTIMNLFYKNVEPYFFSTKSNPASARVCISDTTRPLTMKIALTWLACLYANVILLDDKPTAETPYNCYCIFNLHYCDNMNDVTCEFSF
jgi:hypothetical protein